MLLFYIYIINVFKCIEIHSQDLGIPVYLGGMSRGLLGRNSPINMRQARREALRDADLVILGGSVADFRLSYGRVFSKKSKIIAINRSREQLYKNAGVFWQPSVAVQGDPAKFFVEVANKLKGSFKVDADWVKTLRDRDTEKESKATQMANQPTDQHLNPLKASVCNQCKSKPSNNQAYRVLIRQTNNTHNLLQTKLFIRLGSANTGEHDGR